MTGLKIKERNRLTLGSDPFAAGSHAPWIGPPLKAALAEVRWQIARKTPLVIVEGGAGTGKTLLLDLLERVWCENGGTARRVERGDLAAAAKGDPSDLLLIDEGDLATGSSLRELAQVKTADTIVLVCRNPRPDPALADIHPVLIPLTALQAADARQHLLERAAAAGLPKLFTADALNLVVEAAHGSPRLLRSISSLAFFSAAYDGLQQIGREHVRDALESQLAVMPGSLSPPAAIPTLAAPASALARSAEPVGFTPATLARIRGHLRPWLLPSLGRGFQPVFSGIAAVCVAAILPVLALSPRLTGGEAYQQNVREIPAAAPRIEGKNFGFAAMLLATPAAAAPENQPRVTATASVRTVGSARVTARVVRPPEETARVVVRLPQEWSGVVLAATPTAFAAPRAMREAPQLFISGSMAPDALGAMRIVRDGLAGPERQLVTDVLRASAGTGALGRKSPADKAEIQPGQEGEPASSNEAAGNAAAPGVAVTVVTALSAGQGTLPAAASMSTEQAPASVSFVAALQNSSFVSTAAAPSVGIASLGLTETRISGDNIQKVTPAVLDSAGASQVAGGLVEQTKQLAAVETRNASKQIVELRAVKDAAEQTKSTKEAAEQAKAGKEAADQAKGAKEAADQAKGAKEAAEQAKAAKEAADQAKSAKETADQAKAAKESSDQAKAAKEAADQAKAAKEAADQAKAAKEAADQAKAAKEAADQAKAAKEAANQAKAAKEAADQAKAAKEAADQAKAAKEAADQAKAAKEAADQAKSAKEAADQAKAAKEAADQAKDARDAAKAARDAAKAAERG